jgi:hypothetical protein
LSVVSWYTLASVLYILYHQEVTILGSSFTSTLARLGHLTWAAGKVQALATDTCCQDPCLEKTHTVYACLSTFQDMAHTTNSFDTAGTEEATSIGNFMIHMARCYFEGVSFNFIKPVVEGRNGVDRCHCQMSCPFSQHALNPRKEVGVADCWEARCADPCSLMANPHPFTIWRFYGHWNICTSIFKNRRYDTPTTGGK